MKCPQCGYDMANKSKCLRCGYTVRDIVLIDPEKIEKEEAHKEERREIDPDDVRLSRAGGGGLFESIFSSFFGGSMFGGSMFGGLFDSLFGEPEETGYEYDPKYYDAFGNEIYVPDEFERESVVIDDSVITEEPDGNKEERKAGSSESGEGRAKGGSTFKEKVADKVHDLRDKIRHKPNDKRPPN